MHIPRRIREVLEAKLPPLVLEALNSKFEEAERYCEESKTLQKRNNWLEQQLETKDMQLMQMYQMQQGQGQSNQGIGFKQQGSGMNAQQQNNPYGPPPVYANYNPYWPGGWQQDQGPQYRGGRRGRGSRDVYAQGGGSSGGGSSSGGSGGSGGGASANYDPYEYDEFTAPYIEGRRGGPNENPRITGPGDTPRK